MEGDNPGSGTELGWAPAPNPALGCPTQHQHPYQAPCWVLSPLLDTGMAPGHPMGYQHRSGTPRGALALCWGWTSAPFPGEMQGRQLGTAADTPLWESLTTGDFWLQAAPGTLGTQRGPKCSRGVPMAATGCRTLGLTLTSVLHCSQHSWDPGPPPLGLGGVSHPSSSPLAPPPEGLIPPGQMTGCSGFSSVVGLYWLGETCGAGGVGAAVAWAGGSTHSPVPH